MSHQLIVRADGEAFIVAGNPDTGYTTHRIVETELCGTHRRLYQASRQAHAWPDPPAGADNGND